MRIPALALLALLASAPALRAQHRPPPLPARLEAPAPSGALAALADGQRRAGPEISGPQYAGMFVGGAFGSALGLLAGMVGVGGVAVLQGCIDCGVSDVPVYLLLGAGSTVGTALVVTAVVEEPARAGFWSTVRELGGSPVFRPALLGAAAGTAVGGGLALLVDGIAPSDQPYALVAYNLGQAAASVAAVRIAVGRR